MTMQRTIAACCLLLALACGESRSHARTTAVLVDVSGTYADQRKEVARILRSGLLPKIRPGDSFVLIQIDEKSYDSSAVLASITFDPQPSRANAEKLQLAGKLEKFASSTVRARYTDVSGALMLAAEHLREKGSGHRTIVIFSDMREELPKGARRTFASDEFAGTEIIAMNVKRLAADEADPGAYRARLADWGKRLTQAGAASWKVVLDPEELIQEFSREE
jgi:hypothetical protein